MVRREHCLSEGAHDFRRPFRQTHQEAEASLVPLSLAVLRAYARHHDLVAVLRAYARHHDLELARTAV
ncbi:MAG: hypothetical protein ABSB58_03970 [Gemmatimonadales bacterium]